MRSVILQEFVSLDGLAAGPNDSTDFIPGAMQGDHSFGELQLEFMDAIDTILLGRVTYEMFAQHWPNVPEGAEDKEFADLINAIPKVVFSKTLRSAPWGDYPEARIVKGNAVDEVTKLRRAAGKNIVLWGSLSVAQSLIADAAIDEYRLIVCPVVLGSGKSLFGDDSEPLDMKLLESRAFDRGAVLLTYAAENVAAGVGS